MVCLQGWVMVRALIAVIVLTVRFTAAEAADAHWLCYAVAKAPRAPATLCWPAGAGDEAAPAGDPLAGWPAAGGRDAPRTVEIVNRLGSARVRVKGGGRFVLAPSAGGTPALTCRAARAPGAPRTGPRLVLTDVHGEHVVALRRPECLCEPSDASLPQLLCYRATSRGGSRPDALTVASPRGTQRAKARALQAVCVPTLRPAESPPVGPGAPADPGPSDAADRTADGSCPAVRAGRPDPSAGGPGIARRRAPGVSAHAQRDRRRSSAVHGDGVSRDRRQRGLDGTGPLAIE